jgi:hypothetical protein
MAAGGANCVGYALISLEDLASFDAAFDDLCNTQFRLR